MSPKVAIIIPCHEHAAALRRTLAGVRNQTFKDIEVMVVDDGSSDHPEAVVKDFSDLPIRVIRFETNRGAPAARNEGARLSTVPYLLFLDADATLRPGAVASMAAALEAQADADFVYGDFQWGRKAFRGKPFDVDALKKANYIHTSSLLRRSTFPGFDESLKRFQDWDLWLTMAGRGSKGLYLHEVLFAIEPRGNGMSQWLPAFLFKVPWDWIGWMPRAMRRYKEAEAVIRKKHKI